MTMLDEHFEEAQDRALDIVEQALLAASWTCERSEEGVIHCTAESRWGDCNGMFVWRDEPAAIHFSVTQDLRAPDGKHAQISELLRKFNERLWLGHFDYWSEDGVAVFRHTIPMNDRVAPDAGEISAVLAAAVEAAEQFLPAFNFVVWAGKAPEEAVAAVLFDTAGEA